MHSIIYNHKHFSHRPQLRRRRLVKTRIGQDRPGFEVARHRPIFTQLLTSRIRKAWTHGDSPSRRVILETPWTVQDPMAMVSMTMVKRGPAARIQTVVDHSRI